jgi:Protein of unknown function (DUF559)
MGERDERLAAISAAHGGVVTAAQCLAAGFSRDEVRYRCEVGHWRRLLRGHYLVDPAAERARHDPAAERALHDPAAGRARLESAALRARLTAAMVALGPSAVAVFETAAALHGFDGRPPSAAIHVSIPPGSARAHRRGVRIHQGVLYDSDVVEVGGLRVTSPQRTVADLLRRLDRFGAVSVADSALNKGLIDPADDIVGLLQRRRGAGRARERLLLVDGRAASPLETRVRLICADGGVPPDDLQHTVVDRSGRLLGIADMVWKTQRVIAEADGAAPHGEPRALFRDRRRQNDLVNEGWTVLRFTWADTYRPDYIVAAVRRALA